MSNTNPVTKQQMCDLEEVDWEKCILCQTVMDEKVSDPLKNTDPLKKGIGYTTLASHLTRFSETGQTLPTNIHKYILEGHQDLAEILLDAHAIWHQSCRKKYCEAKVAKAEARAKKVTEDIQDVHTRSRNMGDAYVVGDKRCIFCLKDDDEEVFQVRTDNKDAEIKKYAHALQNSELLARIASQNLISLEAKYHLTCITSQYNLFKQSQTEQSDDQGEHESIHAFALAQLVSYMEECRKNKDKEQFKSVFKLSELVAMYDTRLKELDVVSETRTNSTRLKDRIMAQFPDVLTAEREGKNVYLVFKEDLGGILKTASENHDNETMILAKAASIVRRDNFSMDPSEFNGSLLPHSQEDSIPFTLHALIKMILQGPSIASESLKSTTKASLSIAQLIRYNSVKSRKSKYLSKSRETPLPLYVALSIYAKTRKKEMVELYHTLGLCVSYDRLFTISASLGNSLIQQFETDGVICPRPLRKGLFTVGAYDNIDHNPSSATAKGSFHGTGISIIQSVTNDNPGIEREIPFDKGGSTATIDPLPLEYTDIPPAHLPNKDPKVPIQQGPCKIEANVNDVVSVELRWLDEVNDIIKKEGDLEAEDNISWSAYHASLQGVPDYQVSRNALLPLFYEDSKSVAMVKHGMNIVRNNTNHLNLGQTPIFIVDQPLYAIAKHVQWNWPNSVYGESNYLVMLGGFHIESAALSTIGDWLDGSGWTSLMFKAKVVHGKGVAESLTSASHVTRTRHAHEVTAAALHILMSKAYTAYRADLAEAGVQLSLEDWCAEKASECPQFKFWHITLEFELIILSFVRSLREGNFPLYIESLSLLIPWFFALDHIHYARWLSVHIRDMVSLPAKHPDVSVQFEAGKFVVHKTRRVFSSIAIDQAHEQNNAVVKGDGGAIGLTENPRALARWMVAGPEISRIVSEFESQLKADSKEDLKHHDQSLAVQKSFRDNVTSTVEEFEEAGNPFLETSPQLFALDTKNITDDNVCKTVKNIKQLGQEQYDTFVSERFVERTKTVADPIKKNKLPLFKAKPPKKQTKKDIKSLKHDRDLFGKLYIACQTREGDLDDFFKHENQAAPPSLSDAGEIYMGSKAGLVPCLEKVENDDEMEAIPDNEDNIPDNEEAIPDNEEDVPAATQPTEVRDDVPKADFIILDGAVIVNMLRPGTQKTFQDYAIRLFLPYIELQLTRCERVDIIFDVYKDDSLKAFARSQRGYGIRRRVEGKSQLPSNWASFLRDNDNKTELFTFLARYISTMITSQDKKVFVTLGPDVFANVNDDLSMLTPCSHEEADTRIFLHISHASRAGLLKGTIRSVDTDVVVIAVAQFHKLDLTHLWIAFGMGKSFHYIAVHEIASSIGPLKCRALPVFHAITGCDVVSAFRGRGKKTAWDIWRVYPEVTGAFLQMLVPGSVDEQVMDIIQRFVVLLYDKTSDIMRVNEARKALFTRKGRSIENIPPTEAALLEHSKRAAYQGISWEAALEANPTLESPAKTGWMKGANGIWVPFWTSLPEAMNACRELLHCECRKGCSPTKCTCLKSSLRCTANCRYCPGNCS